MEQEAKIDREQVRRDAEMRWTAYDGLYPVAHAATKEGAVKVARGDGRRQCKPCTRERDRKRDFQAERKARQVYEQSQGNTE